MNNENKGKLTLNLRLKLDFLSFETVGHKIR